MRRPFLLVLLALLLGAGTGTATAQTTGSDEPPGWWQRIRFSGDLRSRMEGFFQDARPTRQRARFRLRLRIDGEVNDDVRVGIRITSGDPDDPISTNQTLNDLFTRKSLTIDRVFMVYNPESAKAFRLGVGKFGHPFMRTQLVWDDDLNWEGAYEELRFARSDRASYRLVALQSPITESSARSDALLFGGYGEADFTLGRHTLQVSAADYAVRQADQVALQVVNDGIGRNTNLLRRDGDRVTGFASDFNLVDLIARLTLATPHRAYPLQFLADVVTNTRAETGDDTGIWLTATYGRAATPKTFRAAYTYARIEQDAVLSTFNFSDIPGSNLRMNRFIFSYMPLPKLNIDFTSILTTRIRVPAGQTDQRRLRTQLDARISF